MRELDEVSIRVAQDGEVADHAADVGRRLDKYSQLPPSFRHLIHLLSLLALKTQVVHT